MRAVGHAFDSQSFGLQKRVTKSMEDLEQFLRSMNQYGETRTSIVMSSPIPRRGVQRF